ncbi:MAG: alpha/beta fold hydrolase [Alphaproteobacteria bacterium]|nr:alpha/beta fold hydrolase [Alphaproteobacteria bacterium]
MRRGLNPLPVYIGMAAAAWPGVMPSDFSDMSDIPKDLPQELKDMLRGIQLYYQCEFDSNRLPLDEVWRAGTVSVNAARGCTYKDGQPVMLLIPSMINKSHILDLMEGRSMLRWMTQQGINAYLLDWGAVNEDEGQVSLDDSILNRLVPALEFLHKKHGRKVHAMGYCMGGTILTGAAKKAEEHLASLIALAAPWDFHAGSQALLNRIKFWAPSALPMIEEKGHLTVEWIQTLFASLDPKATAKKFAAFTKVEEGSDQARLFVAVEDWLNDGVCLPPAIAYSCIRDWFFNNHPYRGEWHIDRLIVHPEELSLPALVIASRKDRLVEYESAAALGEAMAKATIINPDCGHIGMIAGNHSVERVWQPMAAWIKEQAE